MDCWKRPYHYNSSVYLSRHAGKLRGRGGSNRWHAGIGADGQPWHRQCRGSVARSHLTARGNQQVIIQSPSDTAITRDDSGAPDMLIVRSLENGGWIWKLLSITDGKFAGPTAQGPFYNPILDPYTDRVIGGEDGDNHYRFFDPIVEQRWQGILKAFDGPESVTSRPPATSPRSWCWSREQSSDIAMS